MDLDLAQVRAFVAAARYGSMSGAAVELFLSQQALSKRIRRLEERLGPLLVRLPDGVRPTEAGRRFLPAAQRLLDAADAALDAARGATAGPLRVDVWGHAHEPLRLVRRFTDRHPDAAVELSMRRHLVQALAAVRRRELDVALGNVASLPGGLPDGLRARAHNRWW
ncbi:LysR family transcriptional regulator [Dactylosporangium sp. NPDC000244]|uniref:LysR family transcriptional regulator n=1 Tax=Dactylosporangium sp. NPDC000244 TaxID=3154365 RepID=UPI00332E1B8E